VNLASSTRLLKGSPRPRRKQIGWSIVAIIWLALATSDYALLTGRKSMSYNGYANVRCSYWTGVRPHRIQLFGRIGSEDVNCPNLITNVEKW
jgi:hypothetical protein